MNNNNFNLDENTMNNIKKMVDSGNLSGAMSQISPEMIQNFSKMMSNQNDSKNINYNNSNNNSIGSNSQNQNFNNLNPEMIMKLSSAINEMNNKNDSRANLLYSLKPYLRDSRKDKTNFRFTS